MAGSATGGVYAASHGKNHVVLLCRFAYVHATGTILIFCLTESLWSVPGQYSAAQVCPSAMLT